MTTKINSENPQKEVLDNLVKDLGLNDLPEDKRNGIIIKMTEVLLKRIFLETMEKLGEKGREEYEKMSENNITPEEMEVFLKNNIKDYDKMVQNIIKEFKAEMITSNAS